MLMAAHLPLTAQQLLDLHGKSTPKTAQPVSADIKATIPMRDVSNGDHSVTVTYTFTNALLSDDPLYEGSKWWKVGIYIATLIVDGIITDSIKFIVS